tara:strand:- start:236 stop:784 length:549 start_codon:yes stop_codon:yes gene_type:complete
MDVILILPPETTTTFSFDKVATIVISIIALVVSIYSTIINRRESTRKERASIYNSALNIKFLLDVYYESIPSDEAYQSIKPDFDNLKLHLGWMPESYGTLIRKFFMAYNTAKDSIRKANHQRQRRNEDLNTKNNVDVNGYNNRYKEQYAVFEEKFQEAEQLLDDIMEFANPKKSLIKRIFRL